MPSGAAKYDDEGDTRSEQNPASNVETSIVHPALFKVDFLGRGVGEGTSVSSACVTSLCKGRTAAVPRLPSPPPGKIGQPSPHSPLPSLDGIGRCLCPTGCVSPAHKLPPSLQTPASGSRNCRCLDPTWLGLKQAAGGDLFPSPATAILLLLLLAVAGAGQVLLQDHLLPFRPGLGPRVGGGEQHGDGPPASGGGNAGDLLAATSLAPHHIHQAGLLVAQ